MWIVDVKHLHIYKFLQNLDFSRFCSTMENVVHFIFRGGRNEDSDKSVVDSRPFNGL